MKKYNIFFLIGLLLILGAGLIVSMGYPARARYFPVIVIIFCSILVSAELIKEIRKMYVFTAENRKDEPGPPVAETDRDKMSLVAAVSWIAGLALMIWILGFIIALPLFTFIYVKLNGEMWRWAALLSAAMLAIVYVCFVVLLKMPLYEGLVFLN